MASQHPFPWSWRTYYTVPNTAGFIVGASAAMKKIRNRAPLTEKPALVFTSNGDDVLNADEVEKFSTRISVDRELMRLQYNGHDVFLAVDEEDEQFAIEHARKWMSCSLLGDTSQCTYNEPIEEEPWWKIFWPF